MKFFLQDGISDRVDAIIKRLNKLMDGDVSSQMKEHGIEYQLNYGASILWLRNLSKDYNSDNELASRLWHREIRETMILAGMLADTETLSNEELDEWASVMKHDEVAEQLGVNLLWKKEDLFVLANEWLSQDNRFKQAAIWVGLAVYIQRGGKVDKLPLDKYLQIIVKSFETTSKFSLRVQGRFLRQLCRKSEDLLLIVESFVNRVSSRPECAWLVEDVRTEIGFVRNNGI